MARAMRASGERNPNAMRVRSRILVLTDSISPLDRPWSRAASMACAVSHDAAGQLDEGGDAAAPGPGDPPVQGLLAFFALDREHVPQALFEQVGAVQPGVGLGDPGQLGGLAFGEVLGVLPQRVAGALELAGPLMAGRGAVFLPGRPRPRLGSLRASARASFQAWRRSSRASVAQATTWNGSAQRTAVGQRSATTSAIQSAASADTWVICAHRSAPSASKNRRRVAVSRPGAAHTSRPLSWSTTTVRYLWWRL